jgi:signal peptide peptidase SppA
MNLRRHLSWLPIDRLRNPTPVVAVVPLTGVVGRLGPFHRGLTLTGLDRLLERAFGQDDVAAVALTVNSPGGSPVQAALIARRIRALAEEKSLPVFAFAEDVAASGGYWLATAADEIYADESSIIGSIGVVSAGFGFPELLKRLGIERRVYTAGEHKAGLDPFQPEKADEVAHLRRIQEEIHQAFRTQVRARRGARLKAADGDLFDGRFWSGRAALDLGLIDGLGDLRGVMRQRFGDRVRFRRIADGRRWWQRRLGMSAALVRSRDATAVVDDALAAVEERLLWRRYGL